jgi:hypothetical protein
MKRGRGGRSSFSGDVVTVFGANGFIGRGIANRLGKNGSQTIFPYRGEHYKMLRLKVTGDLGQASFKIFRLFKTYSQHFLLGSLLPHGNKGRGLNQTSCVSL